MKRIVFFVLFAMRTLVVGATCEIVSTPPATTTQESAYRSFNTLALKLSLMASDTDLTLLSALNGWNRFGGFNESAQAANLHGRSVINYETYAQLASNGNLKGLPFDHSDALVLAFLVAQHRIKKSGVYADLQKLLAFPSSSSEDLILNFTKHSLSLSEREAPQEIAKAKKFIQSFLAGQLSDEDFHQHYIECIEKKKGRDVTEWNHIANEIGNDYRRAYAFLLANELGLSDTETLKLINPQHTDTLDWDSFLYILKNYSTLEKSLRLISYDIHNQSLHTYFIPMTLEVALRIPTLVRAKKAFWSLLLVMMVSAMTESRMAHSFPMPIEEMLDLTLAVQENKLTFEQFIIFFNVDTYWPSSALRSFSDLKKWRPFQQLLHWYGKSFFPIELKGPPEEYQEDQSAMSIFKPLTGKHINANLILRFASGELNLEAYRAVFNRSVIEPKRGFTGWPWTTTKYFGAPPYADYNTFIEETHKAAIEAALAR